VASALGRWRPCPQEPLAAFCIVQYTIGYHTPERRNVLYKWISKWMHKWTCPPEAGGGMATLPRHPSGGRGKVASVLCNTRAESMYLFRYLGTHLVTCLGTSPNGHRKQATIRQSGETYCTNGYPKECTNGCTNVHAGRLISQWLSIPARRPARHMEIIEVIARACILK